MSRGVLRGLSGSCWPRPPLFTLLQASTSNSQKGEQLQESGMWARMLRRVESLLWELDQSSRNQRRSDRVPSPRTICSPSSPLLNGIR